MERLADAITRDIRNNVYDGAVVMVAQGGKVLLDAALGYADRANGREMQKSDVFAIFSVTKSITAVAALQQVERGLLHLNQPVADLIPEFGVKGKQRITLGNLLCHTAGMPASMPAVGADEHGDLDKVAASACAEVLVSVPGEACQYSPILAYAIIGDLVRRVDPRGRSYREIITQDIFEPLAMNDSHVGMRPDLAARGVPVVVRDRTPGMFAADGIEGLGALILDAEQDAEMPSGGVVSTTADIFRFAEALRQGGTLDGKRIISSAMLDYATQNHTGDMPNSLYQYAREMLGWPQFPASLGLGFFMRGHGRHPTYCGTLNSPGTFTGVGAGSCVFWVDPVRDATFVCQTAGLMEEAHSLERFMRLSDVALAGLDD